MINKKILASLIGAMITVTSTGTAFAAEKTSENSSTKLTQVEAKKIKETKKAEKLSEKLSEFEEKAAKLGINTEGLTIEEIKAKLEEVDQTKLQEEATKSEAENPEVDNTQTSKEEVKPKVDAKEKEVNHGIAKKANRLNIDATGLSNKEAKAKIKEVKAQKKAVKKQAAKKQITKKQITKKQITKVKKSTSKTKKK